MEFVAQVGAVETDPLLLWTTMDFQNYGVIVPPAQHVAPDSIGSTPSPSSSDDFPTFLADMSSTQSLHNSANINVKPELELAASNKRKTEESQGEEDIDQEEKRRRNSAASARFRLKKKMKEQKLENVAKIMSEKAEVLQRRVRVLEAEVKYLRDLLTLRRDREREDQVLSLANEQREQNIALAAVEPSVPESDEDLLL